MLTVSSRLLLVPCLLVVFNRLAEGEPVQSILIENATIVDGTGRPRFEASLRIVGDRIEAVGQIQSRPGERTIDAKGWILAPGFIDLHTHSDRSILGEQTRDNRNYQAQGVTTIVTGNCGSGPIDVADYLTQIDRLGAGTHVAHLIPQGSLRKSVIGNENRPPTSQELDQMKALVESGMKAGAWGMSTGLIYIPSQYASTDELAELAQVVGKRHGLYASHIRDEGTGVLQAINEALEIGHAGAVPVHISHLKASGKAAWGLSQAICDQIRDAREQGRSVTADQYPYIASSTSLGAMVVPDWSLRDGKDGFAKIADDPETGPKLRAEIASAVERRDGGKSVRISRFADRPDWIGLDLEAIAAKEGLDVVELVVQIEKAGGAGAISFGMSEDDVRTIMRESFVATASDGSAHQPGGTDKPHPRSYGTFPRKIRYALDENVISLEQAIASSSYLPASILGLPDRGVIRPGAFADLVLFDPNNFRDLATFEDSTQYATGVQYLFVAGVAVIEQGEFMDKRPGRALRPASDGPADQIILSQRIWTGDPNRPWAEGVAIRGETLAAVGPRDEILSWKGPKTMVLEYPESLITPGLIDAHGHMAMLGESLEEVDLRDVASLEEVQRRVADRLQSLEKDAWVLGSNWDQSLWPGGEFPTAAVLDAVSPDRPIWLRRVDGHAGWANSAALRAAGINAETRAPSDGQILRANDGQPTGVLIDGAMGLVDRVIPGPTPDDLRRQLLRAQEAVVQKGLTGIHDAGISSTVADIYRELERDGQLKVRIHAMANPPTGHEIEFVSRPPQLGEPSARFQLRAIKLFMDGAMGSRGALLEAPYSDDPHNHGLYLIEPTHLRAITEAALKNGWQVCTHAIGDKANRLVLDAYLGALEAVPTAADPRLRVEHAQVVHRADLERFASGRIIASMQPAHAGTDQRWALARLGPDRVLGAYAWRWFADARVPVAFGSDFPVEIVDPLWGLYSAVTRMTHNGDPAGGWHPEQALTLHEALRGFTTGAAHAGFAEQTTGILQPGKQADLTVFSHDLFVEAPSEWLSIEVKATVIAGELVYSADR